MNTELENLRLPPETGPTRKGKVARLPKSARDQVNHMIQDGATYAQVIEKLGDLGKDLTESNLSNWRTGGYPDWLRQQQRMEQIQSKHELAMDLLRENAATTIQEASRQIVAAQLCELMIDFDPTALMEALREKPEFYIRLISALARLSEGDLACAHHRAQEALLKAKLTREQAADSAEVVTGQGLRTAQEKLHLR